MARAGDQLVGELSLVVAVDSLSTLSSAAALHKKYTSTTYILVLVVGLALVRVVAEPTHDEYAVVSEEVEC